MLVPLTEKRHGPNVAPIHKQKLHNWAASFKNNIALTTRYRADDVVRAARGRLLRPPGAGPTFDATSQDSCRFDPAGATNQWHLRLGQEAASADSGWAHRDNCLRSAARRGRARIARSVLCERPLFRRHLFRA